MINLFFKHSFRYTPPLLLLSSYYQKEYFSKYTNKERKCLKNIQKVLIYLIILIYRL